MSLFGFRPLKFFINEIQAITQITTKFPLKKLSPFYKVVH